MARDPLMLSQLLSKELIIWLSDLSLELPDAQIHWQCEDFYRSGSSPWAWPNNQLVRASVCALGIKPSDVVIDACAGDTSGALLALRLGAREVWAIEANPIWYTFSYLRHVRRGWPRGLRYRCGMFGDVRWPNGDLVMALSWHSGEDALYTLRRKAWDHGARRIVHNFGTPPPDLVVEDRKDTWKGMAPCPTARR